MSYLLFCYDVIAAIGDKMNTEIGLIHSLLYYASCDDAEIYRNNKGYFSINVQLICDKTSYVSDVIACWPGSVHDRTVFAYSHFDVPYLM